MSESLAHALEQTKGWPAQLPGHLSPSSLALFGRCPEQYRRRYILGQKERPGGALIVGSADHYAHEVNFRQKITSGVDLPVTDVRLACADGFDQRVATEDINWGDAKPGELKDKAVALASLYHNTVSPSIQPVAVEQRFEVEVPGVPVPIVGYPDIQTADRLIDEKTSGKMKYKPEPQHVFQARVYQIAIGLPLDFHTKSTGKTIGIATPETHPDLAIPYSQPLIDATEERIRLMVHLLLHDLAEFGPDEPWPTSAPDYGWACGYCGWRASCAWWGNS